MDKQEYRLLQIASVAESEPYGGPLFLVHIGLLMFGAFAAFLLFENALFAGVAAIYCTFFAIEKHVASNAHRSADVARYPLVLAILLARALAFNVLVFVVWSNEGDIFKLASMALLVAATINIMVFHATYWALMICVVVPIWIGFSALAIQVGLNEGWSADAIGAICTLFAISPYFMLALMNAHTRWRVQQETRAALNQSQQVESMGKIAGGVSHDFNNILSVVSGSLQLLEHEHDHAERARLLGIANRAIESGASLNKQLLAFGKRSTLLPRATDLHQTLIDFKAFAQNVLPETIQLVFLSSDTRPLAFVDVQMLRTALLNICLNAKMAMPTGGQITVSYGIASAHHAQSAGLRGASRFATVMIRDTGVGMDANALERVFEPFYTTHEAGGGFGLGLPMVKGFVEQSAGGITLDSVVAKGTTVTLFLPLSDERAQPADIVSTKHTNALDHHAQTPKAPKILIVEDNIPLLKIIELRLRKDGLKVVACEDGDQAGRVLDMSDDFDLVLSDFVMPGSLQGPDLLKRIKTAKRCIPFILMSGYADTERYGSQNALKQVDLFVEKPLNLDRLSQDIARLIAHPAQQIF